MNPYLLNVTRAMIAWHGDQKRRYTGEPYAVHPVEVASLVAAVWRGRDCDFVIAAALLHDVLEDTPATFNDVVGVAGTAVADMVQALTNEPVTPGRNRATRKTADRLRLANANDAVQTIKVADLISNADSIRKHDPNFWRVYEREATELLDALVHAHPLLRAELDRVLRPKVF